MHIDTDYHAIYGSLEFIFATLVHLCALYNLCSLPCRWQIFQARPSSM